MVVKLPLQKAERSNNNIFVFILLNIIGYLLLYGYTLPYFDKLSLLTIGVCFFIIDNSLYIYLILSNPGNVFDNNPNTLYNLILEDVCINDYCPQCASKIRPKLRHCVICNVCVEEHDHHCYWVNNCIGKNNLFCFRLFLLTITLNLIYVIILTTISKLNIIYF